jgi:hypothetical protein
VNPCLASSCFRGSTRLELYEALAGLNEYCGLIGISLVATDNNVDIERIELDAAADSASFVSRDQSRA